MLHDVKIADVKQYWNANPLCASAIPHPLGSRDYFLYYDKLREANESLEFSYALHEYKSFAGKRVLDVGCGNGYVLGKYATEGADVQGIDITETAIDLCRKRFEYQGLRGKFDVANAEELPFPDNTFDCVCSMGVLHHTPNTQRAVDQIYRVLKPGGRFITMFYYRDSLMYRWAFAIRAENSGKPLQQFVNEVDGFGNPKGDVYSRRELAHLLRAFTPPEMFTGLLQDWMLQPELGEPMLPEVMKYLERWFGWFLYAKANKPQ